MVIRCILTIVVLLQLSPALAQDRIPARAYQYQRTLHAEVLRQWGLNMPEDAVAIGAGTIHQESAWRPTAQSPYAKGLTQFTDPTWSDMVNLDPSIAALGDVWNPHAAIRAMATYHRAIWRRYGTACDESHRWAFVLSGYNGGPGWVNRDRRLAHDNGSDPNRWWDHVELWSNRADWAIRENRDYADRIWNRWRLLYERF